MTEKDGQKQDDADGNGDVSDDGNDGAPLAEDPMSDGSRHVYGKDAWHCLRNGEQVEEFLLAEPMSVVYQFLFHHWNHGVAAANCESADFEETPKKFPHQMVAFGNRLVGILKRFLSLFVVCHYFFVLLQMQIYALFIIYGF